MLKEFKKLIFQHVDGSLITRYVVNGMLIHFDILNEYEEIFDNIEDALFYLVGHSVDKEAEKRPVLRIVFSQSSRWGDEGLPESPKLIKEENLQYEETTPFFKKLLEDAQKHVNTLKEVYETIKVLHKKISETKVAETNFTEIEQIILLLIEKIENMQKVQGFSTDEEHCILVNLHAIVEVIRSGKLLSVKQKRRQIFRRINNIYNCP